MALRIGLIGLPNVGKSTLFNALTGAGAAVAPYPFTTIKPNRGVAPVPDPRLDGLAELVGPERATPAIVEFVDIAGLVRGAHAGEGLGNQFLGHVRDVDAIAVVCRCFSSPDVAHVEGSLDPVRDLEYLDLELILADLEVAQRRLYKQRRTTKAGLRDENDSLPVLEALEGRLQSGERARVWAAGGSAEVTLAREMSLLTAKQRVLVANVDEESLPLGGSFVQELAVAASAEGSPVAVLCAQLEADLAEWPPEEAAAYRAEVGLDHSGLEELARAGYEALDLITFFTTEGSKEVRAWPVQSGTRAAQAAGKVHSQMERGFIRAEIVPYERLMEVRSWLAARESGVMRIEGRDYEIADGDVCLFRFSS